MNLLSDEIHQCQTCELFPCSLQSEVNGNDVCKSCPIPSRCCNMPLLVLMPREQKKLKVEFTSKGWCIYYKDGCTIYNTCPIACRIASCSWIRAGKVPEKVRRSVYA